MTCQIRDDQDGDDQDGKFLFVACFNNVSSMHSDRKMT